MRLSLIIFFCAISFSASAQFWTKILPKKKHIVLPYLQQAKGHSFIQPERTSSFAGLDIQPNIWETCRYTLESTSKYVMEEAKHNMRFRVYNAASYNFSDLAQLYIKLHRFSEAKWYLLQSNNISRQENDDKHTIANLVSLAAIKSDIGDIPSARADLLEARDMASARGMQAEKVDIEKKILLLVQNSSAPKPDIKYAETTGSEKKAL